ncbi:MAG: BamA/TamA family outer membrane protein [Planctomycetes bacterium]|nr:BamA/TamA family outer membrane protein [Planctomycetota bacterium]
MQRTATLRTLLALLLLAQVVFAAPRLQDAAGPPRQVERFVGLEVKGIVVDGERRYTEERLRAALGIAVGDRLTLEEVEEGIEYLWSLFQVRAEVDGRDVDGGVELRLVVTELPADLEPRFIGNDGVKLDKILEWAELEDHRELFLHQVARVTARVLDGYHREGYYFAEVQPVIRELREGDDPDAPGDVIFEIIEGPQVHVKKVVIHGNQSLPDRGFWFWADGLRAQSKLELKGPSLFDWSGKEFVEETLRADLLAMRTVYRDHGYLNAVVELDRLEFSEDRSGVVVHVAVDEGQPFVVTSVEVQAFSRRPHPDGDRWRPLEDPAELVYDEQALLDELSLRPGKVYTTPLVRADHAALRDFYGKDGYIEHPSLGPKYSWAWLEPELIYDLERAEVKVIYRVAQGRPVRIREIKVNGATHTKDAVIRREISVDPGELADMKEIRASLRRLTSSGYFTDERNRLEHRDPTFRFIPTDQEGLVDIEFAVEEGRVVDFQIAGGVDSNDGLFGIVSLSMRNFDITDLPSSFWGAFGEVYRKEAFHGAGQTLLIEVSPGSQYDRSRIRFVEPDIFGLQRKRVALDVELSQYDRLYEDYDEKRTGRKVRFGYTLGFNTNVWVGINNQDVLIDNVDGDVNLTDPALLSLAAQVGSTSLIGLTLDLDHRDTDTAFNPHDGRVVSWDNEFSTHTLGSNWEYWKSTLTWDEYVPVGSSTEEVRPGIRVALGGGITLPYGRSDFVPYTERFFLGGYSTVRGFRFRGVGPNADVSGTPLGGESMVRASLEYRHPIYSITRPGSYEKVEMLRFHVFTDAGVLGPAYDNLDFDETRMSAGFGFGLMYPFPIVFNFGWPVRDGEFDRHQVFSFSLAFR